MYDPPSRQGHASTPGGDPDAAVADAGRRVDESSRIVVLTGAGISTDSGIPDFRGPQGVWTKDPEAEKLSNIHYYMADPEVRKRAWQGRLRHPAWRAVPNAGHDALVQLERRGRLLALVTQNIDGLHQRAGNSPDLVIEVHGTVHEVICMRCGTRGPMQETLDRVRAGEEDPSCKTCGGILKSATISFGQALVPEVLEQAARAAAKADLFMAVGTSLQVYPVAGLLPIAKRAGASVVIVNAEPTPMDHLADAIISDPISEVLPLMCEWPLRERAPRASHESGAGPSGPRERACQGVRGTKSPDES
jgi:NAD-dependent deacetylase